MTSTLAALGFILAAVAAPALAADGMQVPIAVATEAESRRRFRASSAWPAG
jgi:hypothetical protein